MENRLNNAVIFVAILGLLASLGCGLGRHGEETASKSATAQAEPIFEIRDVKVDKQHLPALNPGEGETYYWKGRATIFARDPNYQKGTFLILLREKYRLRFQSTDFRPVVMKDGTASIDFTVNREQSEDLPKYEATFLGFVELRPGTLEILE